MLICLVGGAVRDILMGRSAQDFDYLVLGATPGQFLERFPKATQVGKAFPVYLVESKEFAFPRTDNCPSCCCAFGDNDLLNDLATDLQARDLTINALALPLSDYPYIPSRAEAWDLAVGTPTSLSDLRANILRPVRGSSLNEDPLRVFRAARFQAQLPTFTAHDELKLAMSSCTAQGLTKDLAPERIGREIRKTLLSQKPGNMIRLLAETGSLNPWFTELTGAVDIPAGPVPHHNESLLEHTAQLMDQVAGDELVCWMALTHDLGKGVTPRDRHPSHHGHDRLGEPLARQLGERLALPNRFIRAGELAARWHMTAGRYSELRPGTRVDMLTALHAQRLTKEMFRLVEADTGQNLHDIVMADLQTMLEVHLPEQWRNKGEESGKRLRHLRCEALSRASAKARPAP
ncbi:Polynucleotide adenylyltransferase region [Desulfovibrio ferrophilus]|uniref:Polynucleotide adenylyltransferase region n=2 Tax=Desulfovibrio ferrophilus TaxID=241368 RepID=A0A2Z6AX99_9BACT|nr:Polynucleotide adenylyltransferase region [Desulfovibrio ferrophilus]